MLKSLTITEVPEVSKKRLSPVHPGDILLEEFLEPLGISQYRLAMDTSVPPRRINEIVHGKRSVTADTALRLARYFGTSPEFWLNLQARYDLDVAEDALGDRLKKEVKRRAA
jgi:addiction module HigA family antidote